MAAVKYSNEAKVDEKIVAQRKAFENAINMQWSDAANTIKSVKDKEKDKKLRDIYTRFRLNIPIK